MNPFEILCAAADAFFKNPRDFLVGAFLTVVLGIVLWEVTLPALLEYYGLVG